VHGARRNRLLIKPTVGSVRASSYTLPSQDFTYGKSSGKDPVTVTELLAHKFEDPRPHQHQLASGPGTDAKAKTRLGSTGTLRRSAKLEGKTFGRSSPRGGNVGDLLFPQARSPSPTAAAPASDAGAGAGSGEGVAAGEAEPAPLSPSKIAQPERSYPDLSGKRTLGRLPEPRPTLTSTLRHAQAHGHALGTATGTTTGAQRRSSAAELADSWKMRQFRDVAPRVPLDGRPLRQNTGH
jgi:hypothetical protein